MKLVLEIEQDDGDRFAWIDTIPLEYESIEKAQQDFKKACERPGFQFLFCGSYFKKSDFHRGIKYSGPAIYTLENWYEQNRIKL